MEYLGGGSALDLLKAGSLDEANICIILREILKGTVAYFDKSIQNSIKKVKCDISSRSPKKFQKIPKKIKFKKSKKSKSKNPLEFYQESPKKLFENPLKIH